MHFVGFIIGIYHDAQSSECQNQSSLRSDRLTPLF